MDPDVPAGTHFAREPEEIGRHARIQVVVTWNLGAGEQLYWLTTNINCPQEELPLEHTAGFQTLESLDMCDWSYEIGLLIESAKRYLTPVVE